MKSRFQEALDLIKPNSKLDYDYLDECSDKEEILKAYDILQELVDKETPKKVDKEVEERELYYEVSYECPTCKDNLNFEKYVKRCPDCGQLLDWSEDGQ